MRARPRHARRACLAVAVLLGLGLGACGTPFEETLPGVYVLDRETYRREALERRRTSQVGLTEGLSGPARRTFDARLAQEAELEAAAVRIRLDLRAEGTFEVVYRYGDEQGHARGTWTVVKDEVRLATTEADGRPLAQPFLAVGQPEEGRLRLSGPRVPLPLPLLRAQAP